MLISFSGLQSTGKSTAIFELAEKLKKRHLSVNLWTDIPRRCPLPFNEDGGSDTQLWITSAMIKETLELSNIYDIVLTDRTPFDCVVYEMVTHEMRHGDQVALSCFAQSLFDMISLFYSNRSHHIFWVNKGYGFKEEKGRSAHTEFFQGSKKWFDHIYDMIRYDLNVQLIDLRELSIDDTFIEMALRT